MHTRAILVILMGLTLGACTTRGRPPLPSRRAPTAYGVTGTALALRGTPYRSGGATPAGFDCSGLVQYVFAQHGIDVPRLVIDQFHAGAPVDPNKIEPGDLVFYSTIAAGASHVGLSIGGDQFVHAPSSNGWVRIERMRSRYWTQRFVGARRIKRNGNR